VQGSNIGQKTIKQYAKRDGKLDLENQYDYYERNI
jgi:hypothetical protein